VGETMAALEARFASQVCTDPIVQNVISTIAVDEAQHARCVPVLVKKERMIPLEN
jgi:hypothetical protein